MPANNSIMQNSCSAIPSGRTAGESSGVGGVGSVIEVVSLLINRKRQDDDLVAYFGFTFPKMLRIFR
jgi:hypothetical protein